MTNYKWMKRTDILQRCLKNTYICGVQQGTTYAHDTNKFQYSFFLQQTLSKKFSFKIFHCDFNVQTGQKRISHMLLVSNQDFEIF